MHLLILLFSVFFDKLQRCILCLALSNLHMNNLSNDILSTIKQLVDDTLLFFITHNVKTYELNSNLKIKSE